MDGNESEQRLANLLRNMIPGFQGVPTYIGYVDGQFIGVHDGGRTIEDLERFGLSML